jgi:hypothetical protein
VREAEEVRAGEEARGEAARKGVAIRRQRLPVLLLLLRDDLPRRLPWLPPPRAR